MILKACTLAARIFICLYLFIYVEDGSHLQPPPPSKPRIVNIRVRDLGFGMVLYLIVLNLNIFSDIDGDSSLALLKLEIIRFEHRELKFLWVIV